MKLTLDQINKIPDVQAREKLKRDIIEGYEFQKKEAAKQDFLTFVKRMWPQFIEGKHHKIISEKFNKIASGTNPSYSSKEFMLLKPLELIPGFETLTS